MFTITHFRSEFIHQGQATILPRTTMTQFFFVILALLIGVALFGLPLWFAPILIVLGYCMGIVYHGEIVLKRLLAYLIVRGRDMTGQPRIINIQQEWDTVRQLAERQDSQVLFPATVMLEERR